jgi:HSP20 family protein
VNLDRTLLTIKGSRSEEKSDQNKDYKVTERSAGTFVRVINLPFEPDDGKVNGTLDKGVLTLVIEKPANEAVNARKIPIGSVKKETAAA